MFAPDDTIVAIATPAGRGGIGVVRVSGTHAPRIAQALTNRAASFEPRRATFARIGRAGHEHALDEVIVTLFEAPGSYTGDDVIEISAHGNPVVLRSSVEGAMAAGARLARPGEFTLRAFLNGKRDLVQAEAVGDLIAAATPLQARVAFDQLDGTLTARIAGIDSRLYDLIVRLEASIDFPDEGYHFIEPQEIVSRVADALAMVDVLLADANRGRMIREGATVVIAGRTNVGKSSIFNALAGSNRAIVTEIPGTTRDLVSERIDVHGIEITLVDTAGARDTADLVEMEGVSRGSRAREAADLVLIVLDQSVPPTRDDCRVIDQTAQLRRVIVANKCDRDIDPAFAAFASGRPELTMATVSATSGEGLDKLRCAIAEALTGGDVLRDAPAVSNTRHIALLRDARQALATVRDAASTGPAPEEFLLADLQAARRSFDEIVGVRTSEDILRTIFERFCIGK
jgi:tRNA modification GTPase